MEERFKLYFQLIQQLLACPEGEELELLEANSDLFDLGLLFAMQWVANDFAENDNSNTSEWLPSFAQWLVQQMGFNSADEMYQEYLNCLFEILQAVAENPTAEVIYPLLKNHLEKLNLNLGFVLYTWAKETLSTVESEQAQAIARGIFNFGSLIRQFPVNKADNLELAIMAYQNALIILTQKDFPVDWAATQNNLGNAYTERIKEDRAQNLEQAIASYENALIIRTQKDFPVDCLQTARSLGNLHFDQGNWELAIQAYQKAISAIEITRNCATNDLRRQEIIANSMDVYEKMIQACINKGQLDLASAVRF